MQSGTTTRAPLESNCFHGCNAHFSQPDPLPIVVIDQNMPALGNLIQCYLGLAQIALVPSQRAGRRLLASLADQDVEILAVIGFTADASTIRSAGTNHKKR